MKNEYVVVLDQGSSSSRALLMSCTSEKILLKSQVKITPEYPKTSYAEYDAEELYNSLYKALKETINNVPESGYVSAIGIAAQRSTLIIWDKTNGKPLCKAMSWQDGRAADIISKLDISDSEIHKITGLYKTPYYSASKLVWSLINDKNVSESAKKGNLCAGSVATYFIWRLTEGKSFVIDPSLAQRTLLMDLKSHAWSKKLLKLFGLKEKYLPNIVDCSSYAGDVVIGRHNIKIMSLLGDQQSAMLGLDIKKGEGAINYGTGAFLLVNTGSKIVNIRGLLNSYGWKLPDSDKVCYLSESIVNSAGATMQWLQKNLCLFNDISEVDNMCRQSKNTVFSLPVIGGLASPYWDYNVKTSFCGLTALTNKNDIVCSVVRGIAFMLAECVDLLRRKNIEINTLKTSGGLSQINYLMQFQADITGANIFVTEEKEATALGIWRMLVQSAGHTKNAERLKCKTFYPKISAQERQKLLKDWHSFVEQNRYMCKKVKFG